jgi:hypothetical protein
MPLRDTTCRWRQAAQSTDGHPPRCGCRKLFLAMLNRAIMLCGLAAGKRTSEEDPMD